MKTFHPWLLVVGLLCAVITPGVAAEPVKVVIHDFTQSGFDYGFVGWDGLGVQTKTSAGYRIEGPSNGGAGFSLFQLADLSNCKTLIVKLRRGPNMTDSRIAVNLIDVSGSHASWSVPVDGLSDKDFTEVKLDLSKPTDPPAKPLNLEEIKNVQVQGVFTPDKTVDLEFASLTAVQ